MTMSEPGTKYADRFFALLRRRAPAIAVFVVLMTLFDATRAWSENDTTNGFVEGITTSARVNWVLILASALAPYIVEAAYFRPIMRAVLSVLVTFFLVAIPALVIGLLFEGPITPGVRDGRLLSNATFLVRSWWLYSVAGLLFAAYCQTRDREIATIRAARTAELERADAQRDIMASRLQVLQARVEPELLFGALGDVRGAYLRDPDAAGALLDDLIAYLRAALPQMRGGTSTLLRETTLAEAYLKVVPAGRSGALAVDVEVADIVGSAPFPPMVLLPLAHAASEAMPAAIRIRAPAGRVAAASSGNSIEMRVEACGIPAGWQEAELLAIRGALQNYFGATATLRIESTSERVSAIVTWSVETGTDHVFGRPDASEIVK
jgi:Histidine kinase